MFDLEKFIEHAIDKEIFVIQSIMILLENNNVSYDEWERLLPILSALVEEQKGCPQIKYLGEPI